MPKAFSITDMLGHVNDHQLLTKPVVSDKKPTHG